MTVWVLVAGAVGALARSEVTRLVHARFGTRGPWGTAVVNLLGVLGLAVLHVAAERWTLSPATVSIVGAGLFGAFTTFSTWALEAVRVEELWGRWWAIAHLVGLALAGVALAWVVAAGS